MTVGPEDSAQREAARERMRAVWDAMASGWDELREQFWEFSRPVGEWLVSNLDPRPGHTVLELAAGLGDTGFLAARLVGATGRVITTDFAPEMVAAARRRAAELGVHNVEFRVLDAERMDLETDSVDGVLCRWGYMLMADPAAAFSETRRVLRQGGRLAFTVFAAPEHNPWISVPVRTLVARGHMPAPDPRAPGMFALADRSRIRELVTTAGFADPRIVEMPLRWRFRDQEAYWRLLPKMAGAIAPIVRALSPQDQAAVREQVHEAARPYHSGAGYDFPVLCLNTVTH